MLDNRFELPIYRNRAFSLNFTLRQDLNLYINEQPIELVVRLYSPTYEP
jgi:isocitrate dehydrogenase